MTSNQSLSPASEASPQALLIVDMISNWDFPDAESIVPFAERIAPRIAELQARCRRNGVPIIFANDNHGRWRSDFRSLVDASLTSDRGARITAQIQPQETDYFVLKPMHSAFFATPLELLLADLNTKEVLVAGISTDQCVVVTVAEARMRGLDVRVLADCTATQSAARHKRALLHLVEALRVETPEASEVKLKRGGRR